MLLQVLSTAKILHILIVLMNRTHTQKRVIIWQMSRDLTIGNFWNNILKSLEYWTLFLIRRINELIERAIFVMPNISLPKHAENC